MCDMKYFFVRQKGLIPSGTTASGGSGVTVGVAVSVGAGVAVGVTGVGVGCGVSVGGMGVIVGVSVGSERNGIVEQPVKPVTTDITIIEKTNSFIFLETNMVITLSFKIAQIITSRNFVEESFCNLI